MSSSQGGRKPEYTDEEIVEAVRQTCDRIEAPVIDSNALSETLGYSQKTAREKLKRLACEEELGKKSFGNVSVYWPPEEGATGEVTLDVLDDSQIDYADLDVDEIPKDDAERLFAQLETRLETWWQERYKSAGETTRIGVYIFALAFGILATDQVPLPRMVAGWGLVVGLGTILIGGAVAGFSYSGQWAHRRGWATQNPFKEGRIAPYWGWLSDRAPFL